ncbi:MAG: alpha/beta fold hydrolase [Parvibaculaceae bacterium]
MPTLRSGQASLHYEVHGSGPPILFAHESTGQCESWLPQVEHFARRHTCILYNARGYPPSDAPADPNAYSQAIFVADMLAMLDGLKIERAHIVGLSMGSMTALHFGLRHPSRATSIVLAGTGPGQSRAAVEVFKTGVLALAGKLDGEGWNAILEEYDSAPDRRALRWKNPALHRAYCAALRARNGALSALILRQVVGERPVLAELAAELRAMDVPVLIATGDADDDCLPTSLFLKETLPHAGLAVFPRTGHAVNLEEPAVFNSLVEAFHASVTDGRW